MEDKIRRQLKIQHKLKLKNKKINNVSRVKLFNKGRKSNKNFIEETADV